MDKKDLITGLDENEFTVPVSEELPKKWKKFIDSIKSEVYGQDRAIRKLVRKIIIASSATQSTESPPSPTFLAGPPGTGKTYLAKVIAEKWLGKPEYGGISPLVKISGENFRSYHEGSTLKGAPPGYVGYQDMSPLEYVGHFDMEQKFKEVEDVLTNCTNAMLRKFGTRSVPNNMQEAYEMFLGHLITGYINRAKPFRSVLLVDEFEKMHPDIQKQFLSILQEGELQLHNGRTIDFKGTLIIFTSNIGTEQITSLLEGNSFGLGARGKVDKDERNLDQEIYKIVKKEIKRRLDPAIYSRIGSDGIVVFHELSDDDYLRIIKKEVEKIQHAFSGSEGKSALLIKTSTAFDEFILASADAKREGARQIGRLIDKHLKERLAIAIENKQIKNGDAIIFDIKTKNGEPYVIIKRLPRPVGLRFNTIKTQNDEFLDAQDKLDILETIADYWQRNYKPDLELPTPQDNGDDKPKKG